MIKTNVMRILETAGIAFQAYEYDATEGVDAVSVAGYLHKSADQIFKTLVVEASPAEHFVFVISAASTLDLKKAAKVAGVKQVSMLPQKRLLPLTGYVHGGCSPIGMKKSFPTFIDETAILFDTICVSGGKIGVTIELAGQALADLIGASFCDITMDNI